MTHSQRRKLFGIAIFLVVAGLLILFFTRPAATLTSLQAAVAARDYGALNELVDFPELRASVKADLLQDLELRDDESASTGERIGAMLGGMLLGPMVDVVVSPLGLAYILEGYSPKETIHNARAGTRTEVPRRAQVTYATSWDSLSSYSVTIMENDKPLSLLVFHRYRLFQWKLAYMDLTPPFADAQ